MRRGGIVGVLAALVLSGWVTSASAGKTDVPTPTVTGPVTGGQGHPSLLSTNIDLGALGYTSDEYFIEGEAVAYEPVDEPSVDGEWTVREAGTEGYKTRIVVYKPADPADFDGTVYVEWFNVSAGFDNAIEWLNLHHEIVRQGAAYVGVSAQQVGVQGGEEALEGATTGGIKAGDPERYGSLAHPGDAFSYDIFTQAGVVASGDGDGARPFEGYDVERVIAIGESQSAFRLTSYVNAVQPRAEVFDGFLIHSRGGSAAGFANESGPYSFDESIPLGVRIRDDIGVPVLTFETETDLTRLQFAPARQPDTKHVRLWEVAGTAHADAYTGTVGVTDAGDGSAELQQLDPARASGGALSCTTPVNAGAQYVALSAALARLSEWVDGAAPPPKQPRIETTGKGEELEIVRDDLGIAEGGIRTPIVDAPLAANTGAVNDGGSFCSLFGTTAPLDAATLAELYPGGVDEWRERFAKAAEQAVDDGIWAKAPAERFVAASEQITFP